MFCKNCGSPLAEGDKVCGKCGAPVPAAPASAPVKAPGRALLQNVKLLLVVLAALHVLQLILWFSPFLSASASAFGERISESASIAELCSEEETEFFTPLFVVIYIAAAVLALLPLVIKGKPRRHRMIFSKITAVLSFGMVLLMNYAVNESNHHSIKVSYTFGGWLQILIPFGIIALTVVISSKSKQPKRNKVNP